MRAIRVREFGGPDKLVLEEVPNLEPDEGEVLVEIQFTGCCCSTLPMRICLPSIPLWAPCCKQECFAL